MCEVSLVSGLLQDRARLPTNQTQTVLIYYVCSQGNAGKVEYALDLESSTPTDIDRWFYINTVTGNITVVGQLDRDTAQRMTYTVSRLWIWSVCTYVVVARVQWSY